MSDNKKEYEALLNLAGERVIGGVSKNQAKPEDVRLFGGYLGHTIQKLSANQMRTLRATILRFPDTPFCQGYMSAIMDILSAAERTLERNNKGK